MSSGQKRKLDEFISDHEVSNRSVPISNNRFDFTITETKRQEIDKFNACEVFFEVKVTFTLGDATSQRTSQDVSEGLHRLFGAVLEKVSGALGPNDIIRLAIRPQGFRYRISTGLMASHLMTPEKILSACEECGGIPLKNPFSIEVLMMKGPHLC